MPFSRGGMKQKKKKKTCERTQKTESKKRRKERTNQTPRKMSQPGVLRASTIARHSTKYQSKSNKGASLWKADDGTETSPGQKGGKHRESYGVTVKAQGKRKR